VSRPLVLDASALLALFDAYDPIYRLWIRADRGELLLIVPAVAIADANRALEASHGAWFTVLAPRDVVTTALSDHVAIDIGPWPGELAARHVVYEAQAVRGIVVTRTPDAYKVGSVPLLVL
jgi:hypothetical protein